MIQNYKQKGSVWKTLLIWLFSAGVSSTIVLGYHIHVTSPYDALASENYIIPYSGSDFLVFFMLLLGIRLILYFSLPLIAPGNGTIQYRRLPQWEQKYRFLCTMLLVLLCWVPWLLHYWPGFVFPDTYNALQQALYQTPLNNRNPVLFTFFLRACLLLGGAFRSGDITRSCLLFTVFQMISMAAGFSFLTCWCYARFSLKSRWWCVLAVVIYGLNPYVAQDSIAMWKDPLFSTAIVIWSLLLTDLILSEGEVLRRKGWTVSFAALMLFVLFWRNNGFCAVSAAICFLLLISIKRKQYRKSLAILLPGILLWAFVNTLIFKAVGIGMPKEESAGLMLNQMARVVVYEGDMDEEEREYLNELMPLSRYPEAYRPCCVDLLKWDGEFNYDALGGSRFLRTWISLFIKNPRIYFDAWELETYGYWTINRPEINFNIRNISDGNPYNSKEDSTFYVGDAKIQFRTILNSSFWEKILPKDFWSVPLGLIHWLILFEMLILSVGKKTELSVLFIPSLGVLAGLTLGAPIWYLARYGACAQFLLPVFLLLIIQRKTVTI